MTSSPKTKKQKLNKPLFISASTRATAINWRDPQDVSRDFSNSLDPWITLAQVAEKGKFHSIFFIDHLTWFDVYGNDHEGAARGGVNASRIDPTAALAALALVTKNIGFGVTVSTVSEHPYHFARRLASLDQLTNGRIGWNIVGSYLPSTGANLLNGAPLPEHDERYTKTQEFTDAVYSLLLSSWRDDAVVYDKAKGIFADPKAIRKINHKGKYYDIPGPSITEPTKQRFPLILQAGSSKRGKLLAAENAELVYIHNTDKTRSDIEDVRRSAKEIFGRDPNSIKFIINLTAYVGNTHEEAVAKQEAAKSLQVAENAFVYFGGHSHINVKDLGWDEPIPFEGEVQGVAESADKLKSQDGKTNNSKKQLYEKQLNSRSKYVGTPIEVADLIEETILKTGADGLNFSQTSFPSGLEDIVDLLIPELQKRGLAQKEYAAPGGTFRENFYGEKGQTFVPENHPAHNLRWRAGVSAEEFEKDLNQYVVLRDQRRETSLNQ